MRAKWIPFLAILILAPILASAVSAAPADSAQAAPEPPLLEQVLAGPLKDVNEILFVTRLPYNDPHWYANIGYYCDDETSRAYAGNDLRPDIGKILKLDIRKGAVTTLFDAQGGSVRDPQVQYDARKLVFSYRPAGEHFYNLYEIDVDGSNLRRITSGPFDDIEPTYLPDGDILFISTRCNRWVNCWMTQVGIMYRCTADGADIRPVSANTEHDNTPWVLPDGRIVYTRWEYVDRSQVEFHHLWAMNPDGTGATILYGNMHPNTVMIDAKPIPGTNKVLANFSPGHGVSDHSGIATIVSPDAGPDERAYARPFHKGRLVRDPYPLNEDCILAARDKQICLIGADGRTRVLFTLEGDGGVHEPRPIQPRPRERLIPPRVDWKQATGRFVLSDVYNGRNLPGVRRGEIRKLLVLETLPKQVNFSGGQDLLTWLGTFSLERALGAVPVEADGSAYFEAPAGRQLYFVALDENDLSVKRMQSFTSVMPGETIGCVGCHERREQTPENRAPNALLALQRAPSAIEAFHGFPDVIDFPRDIQPILDRHCVACHSYETREGHLILAGDLGPNWSHSYFNLFAHGLVADGRNGLGNQPPRSIGSAASALLTKIDGSHHEAVLTDHERRLLWLWIETGATYVGSYAGLRNAETQGAAARAGRHILVSGRGVLQRRCGECHAIGESSDARRRPLPFAIDTSRDKRGIRRPAGAYERIVLDNDPLARYSANILLNFTRPACSPLLLGPLATGAGGFGSCGDVFKDTNDPDYRDLLAAIERAKAIIEFEPRYATPGFRPNRQYIREMQKYGILPDAFDRRRDTLDVFETDQKYWRSLWYEPVPETHPAIKRWRFRSM